MDRLGVLAEAAGLGVGGGFADGVGSGLGCAAGFAAPPGGRLVGVGPDAGSAVGGKEDAGGATLGGGAGSAAGDAAMAAAAGTSAALAEGAAGEPEVPKRVNANSSPTAPSATTPASAPRTQLRLGALGAWVSAQAAAVFAPAWSGRGAAPGSVAAITTVPVAATESALSVADTAMARVIETRARGGANGPSA